MRLSRLNESDEYDGLGVTDNFGDKEDPHMLHGRDPDFSCDIAGRRVEAWLMGRPGGRLSRTCMVYVDGSHLEDEAYVDDQAFEEIAKYFGVPVYPVGQACYDIMFKIRDSLVTEGVVAAARGDAVKIINNIASEIGQSAQNITGTTPQIQFTDSDSNPATITLLLNGQYAQIIVYGDGAGEIVLELSEVLASQYGMPRQSTLSSVADVSKRLGFLIGRLRRI